MIALFSQAQHSAELQRISFLAYLTSSADPRTFLLLSVKFHFNLFKIPTSYPVLISSPHFSPMKIGTCLKGVGVGEDALSLCGGRRRGSGSFSGSGILD